MTDLDKLVKLRSIARGWVTRTEKNLIKLTTSGTCTLMELGDALTEFDKRLEKLDEAQVGVEVELPDADIEADLDQAATFREKVQTTRREAAKLFEDMQSTSNAADDTQSEAGSVTSELRRVQLPKLELPKFSGAITEWQAFWDKFTAIVDSSDLPVVTKFTYLHSLLEGEAKRTVEGLSLTSAHYAIACTLLKEKYGKPEPIIFSHIQALLSLKVDSASTGGLRRMQEELLTHIRCLEALDIKGETYGVVLTPVILSRLPNDIRLEWSRGSAGKEADLEWLLQFLKQEVDRRERSEAFKPEETPRQNFKQEEKRRKPTTSALHTTTARGCGFCSGRHSTEKCRDFLKLDMPDRKVKIKEARLCFRCLGNGHYAKACAAVCRSCKGQHHELCCTGQKPEMKDEVSMTETEAPRSNVTLAPSKRDNDTVTILQTARVLVLGAQSVEATLLFDNGSDRSYISSSLVTRAGLKPCSKINVSYSPFGGGKSGSQVRNVYKLHTRGLLGGDGNVDPFLATEVPVICSPLQRPKLPTNVFDSLSGIQLADKLDADQNLSIDILIGLDHYWRLMKNGFLRLDNGPVAQESAYGWVLSGSYLGSGPALCSIQTHQLLSFEDVPERVLRDFWNLESIGIKPNEADACEDLILERFRKGVVFDGERYEVDLPWKMDGPQLLNNFQSAKVRLGSLYRKLDKDLELKCRYDAVMTEMEETDIIEEVSGEELGSPPNWPVYYLPHHPVVKESSTTTKVRPVFDASAVGPNNVSLNDCLETGPSLIPNLVEVLLRFRRWKVALTADIKKAFLQVKLRKADQDVHRFLLRDQGGVRVMRFKRVTFGVKSSPFLLNATIQHHLSSLPSSQAVSELTTNLYVDDWLTGADSESEALSMFAEARDIMLRAGMELSKWNSNSGLVKAKVVDQLGSSLDPTGMKILGVKWCPSMDVFSFDGIEIPDDIMTTKRVVLSFIARMFDPLGLATPFTMLAKILFQELWQKGLGWDDPVEDTLHSKFIQWVDGIECLRHWTIPRSFSSSPWRNIKDLELHAFGDASEKGYGAVVYLRIPVSSGGFETALVMSKAKVAPLRRVTLPRLELLGSLLAARLSKFVCEALQLTDVLCKFWTDSTVALAWIQGDPNRWKQFVANRVREIQDITSPSDWSHCPGKDNPADLLTRGMYAEDLRLSKLWLSGPGWLQRSADEFPSSFHQCGDTCEEESVLVNISPVVPVPQSVFEVHRWGRLSKAIRVVAWVMRFAHNAKVTATRRIKGDFSYEELLAAKIKLFLDAQAKEYPQEICDLKSGRDIRAKSSISRLTPFVGEDGLLRVKGRLQLAEMSFEDKHPIILPSGHLALLIVRFQHLLLKHAGVATLITSLRDSYWIVGLRRVAKGVKRECVSCQKQDAKACCEPVAPLPSLRVTEAPPFSVTGVDFAGPLFCSDLKKKLYVCLFTCAVVRAVHLELTESLSLQHFLLALRRFASRRGLPTVIYSDNATTFKGADRQLQAYFGPNAPEWKFIAPRSPWWGGWWERLVRSVKVALRKDIGTRCLSRCELETTLHEVEACVNSRPLSFCGDDIESTTPLTPSHLLLGRKAGFQVNVVDEYQAVTTQTLLAQEQVRHQLLDKFWFVWRNEYLRGLPHAVSKFRHKGRLHVGSVVLIREDNTPRMQWDMGVVTKLYRSKDGVVRSATLNTKRGIRTRAIQRLHDLEVSHGSPIPPEGDSNEGDNGGSSCVKTRSGRVIKPKVRLDW